MDILVIKMSSLGDVIQALPVIPVLKKQFPTARIHWLVEEAAEPVLRCHPGVDTILVSRRSSWPRQFKKPENWPVTISQIRALVGQLRRPYDIAIDLQGLLKSGIWMGLARARRKVGLRWTKERISKIFLHETLGDVNGQMHAVERYLELAAGLGGCHVKEPEFGLQAPKEAKARMIEFLASRGWDPQTPWAVLVPSARWQSKRWSPTAFARVGDGLIESLGFQVALVGVQEEIPYLESIRANMKNPALNLGGSTDIPGLMAMLEMAKVVVSTDSGPMHMAAALGTPVVAIFGPTAPWRTGPYGANNIVVRKEIFCSPCFKRRCVTKACMEAIDPEEVLEKVNFLMKKARANGCPLKPVEAVAGEASS